MRAYFAFFALFPLLAPLPSRAETALLDWARDFERLGDRRSARAFPGDLGGDYGLIADASCLTGEDRDAKEELKTRLNEAVLAALGKVRACDGELGGVPFFPRAVAVLRRMKLVCVPASEDEAFQGESPAGAYTVWRDNVREHPRLRRLARRDRHDLYMVLPGSLRAFLDRGELDSSRSLFHESLHQTWANSRWDHNRIERVAYDAENACAENLLDDRVIFFQTACGFDRSDAGDLRHRIRHCGLWLACLDTASQVEGVPEDAGRRSRRRFGSAWSGYPRKVMDLCERVRDSLDERARRGEIPDLDARNRVERAWRALHDAPGGLAGGIPQGYVDALAPAQRDALGDRAALAESIRAGCGWPASAAIEGGRTQRTLREINPGDLDADCPFYSGHPAHARVAPLVEFHNQEARLQEASRALLLKVKRLADFAEGSPFVLGKEAVSLYMDSCPLHVSQFRPALCETGEAELLDAIAEIGDALKIRGWVEE